jgi:hypothetical protein
MGAYELSSFIADQLGFTLLGRRIVPLAFYIQIAVGILVPLLAGFGPVINGSRITVLNAISGDTTSDGGGQAAGGAPRESAFDRFQQRATQWPSPNAESTSRVPC